jgi:transaldolase
MANLSDLRIKIFADGADLNGILATAEKDWVSGFTTNPTLMRKAGVADYKSFALEVLRVVPDRPVSFEVLADDFLTMERQAHEIAGWGPNVNVKIPVTNTKGQPSAPLIGRLSRTGVQINATAVFTIDQVRRIADALDPATPAIVSLFAGRIADAGHDPVPMIWDALDILAPLPKAELLWASPREILNLLQANASGCHIITMTNDLLAKVDGLGKPLDRFSQETVEMFHRDATAAGYSIDTTAQPAPRLLSVG